ncbi:hypothetical protein N866_14665 [Actinotalea ferrariae CF5-4]|uniref:Uncharacterized protein n=1 Tax=Actinotalea ferrariae CF5-4 TaxID=948458 RepID=A0A021VLD1_9CELL|nr:hypothetical protein [Actinotalea ferrariae]EYR61888.1 hypothetical protein N866_14665 [Actinotalea ferrariae CF5-4]
MSLEAAKDRLYRAGARVFGYMGPVRFGGHRDAVLAVRYADGNPRALVYHDGDQPEAVQAEALDLAYQVIVHGLPDDRWERWTNGTVSGREWRVDRRT